MGDQYQNEDWLRSQLNDGNSPKDIAEDCGVARATVYNWARRFQIDLKEYREERSESDGSDRRNIVIPLTTDKEGLHGFEHHKARKDELGVTWLEYVNSVAPEPSEGVDVAVDADAIAERVVARLDVPDGESGDVAGAVSEAVARAVEPGDIREAAYHGAREAVEEAAYQ